MAARIAKCLWRVSVRIAPEAEEAAAELLADIFGEPTAIYVDLESNRTTASVFVSHVKPAQRQAVRAGMRRLRACRIDPGSGRVSVTRIRVENWAESWKRHFKPIEIGSRLLIKPGWSRRRPKPGQAVVVLDPGLSFGTGQHPTTEFCLQHIASARRDSDRQSFLDIGTGSGILAISASKLGYRPVAAFDFDRTAVKAATENARRNRVRIPVRQHDLMKLPWRSAKRFDLVCANLTYDLLIAGRERILNRVSPGGMLILAGILTRQFAQVARAYQSSAVRLVGVRTSGEWKSGAFRVL